MAGESAVAAAAGSVLTETPFLVKVWRAVVTESSTVIVTHGEDRAPDVVIPVSSSANPTGADLSVTARAATTFTVDCEDDGNDTFDVYAIWFSQASGGLTNVS